MIGRAVELTEALRELARIEATGDGRALAKQAARVAELFRGSDVVLLDGDAARNLEKRAERGR